MHQCLSESGTAWRRNEMRTLKRKGLGLGLDLEKEGVRVQQLERGGAEWPRGRQEAPDGGADVNHSPPRLGRGSETLQHWHA